MADNHSKGLLLTGLGGLALTVDIPLIKLAAGNSWSILMTRSGVTFLAAIVIWSVWRSFDRNAPKLIPGKAGLVVASLYGIGSVTFITAVYNTSTANLVFILAFNTVFAAVLSWIFLREKPRPATMLAMLFMVGGVLIIVGGSIGTGHLFGDLMAVCSAFCIATAITISRASGKDMGFTALVGVLFPCLVAMFMVSKTGFQIDAPWWPEVAMFYLLETVLAPIWVWMIFAEVPTTNSLIGGMILIVTLVAHSAWQLSESRKRRAGAALQQAAL